jgi:hypothetical protein
MPTPRRPISREPFRLPPPAQVLARAGACEREVRTPWGGGEDELSARRSEVPAGRGELARRAWADRQSGPPHLEASIW